MKNKVAIFAWLVILARCTGAGPEEWPVYQGFGSNQYSALDQINRSNVHTLEVAWTYRTGDSDPDNRSQIQANPIVVDGILYATSAQLKVFALDATTGLHRWTFDPFASSALETEGSDNGYDLFGAGVSRGVTYWEDGEDRRIFSTGGSFLYAIEASTGHLITTFGDKGAIDLHDGLGRDVEDLFIVSNTPGVVYKDLLIVPTRVAEGTKAAPGHIRAYDVRTGEIAWIFHTIPQPGEFGYETWPRDAWKSTGGANNWAGMTVDDDRGVVYVPTGSATPDFYGGDRIGANLFANTLLALDASTGHLIWHYQVVRHDLWDRDLPAPPNLVSVTHAGQRHDAVAQITKSGHVFLFDRDTGEPLFPIEERQTPPSDLSGEVAWKTQPVPLKPPPFSRQVFLQDDVTDISSNARSEALEQLSRVRTGDPFTPPSREGTIIFPGYDGGGEWGGAAVDPNGILYVNASEMPWILRMIKVEDDMQNPGHAVYSNECLYCHGVDGRGDPLGIYPSLVDVPTKLTKSTVARIITRGVGVMPSHEYLSEQEVDDLVAYLFSENALLSHDNKERKPIQDASDANYSSTGYVRFLDSNGYPAIKPPWGTLTAIDLNIGNILWQVTLGEFELLTQKGFSPTGTENYGGPIVTAGGLLFIAATKDERFRGFDIRDGALLWETKLPAGGYATPATYMIDGRQFVVVAAGGGKMGTKSGDAYVAFALPDD